MSQIQFTPFTCQLMTWNGKEIYDAERSELDWQIELLISLQSGLGQSSQGRPEDHNHRAVLEKECDALKKSIATALRIT